MSHHIKSNLFSYYYSFHLIIILFLLNINLNNSLISNKRSNEYLGSTGKHLFHFVHVTDIHVTHLGNADRMEQFEQFCNETIKTIVKPQVTVVSGDLVNNVAGFTQRFGRGLSTAQYEQEWKMYRDILDRTNVTKYTKWLDIRGNHDAFMDPDLDSIKSFYRIYSNQGHDHSGSYEYTLRTNDGDKYSFISVDLCPTPGLGVPFNLFGHLTNKEKDTLIKFSRQTKNSTSVIFFGHYPLAFTYPNGLDQIMKYGLVYLNGHLHSGFKHLYARHSDGLLELELGDWKRGRRFRIVTIDSGLLSFGDFQFNQSIYAVISNPKAAQFHTPREPLYRLKRSTHIRILIFSKFSVVNVNISIDGQYLGSAIQSIDNQNLFILPWNTSFYNDENIHEISVEIKGEGNNTMSLKHEFSLSLSTVTKWNRSKLILTINQPTFFFVVFAVSLFIYILILLFYRYQAKHKRFSVTGRFSFWNQFRLRMTLLCSVDLMYYSLSGLALYHFIGPWFIGYLTEGHFGATFLWGTLIRGVYLQTDSHVLLGTFHLYFFIFPLTFCLSSSCYHRFSQLENLIQSRFNRWFRIYTVYILFLYALAFNLLWSFIMTSSYRLSWIISPFGLSLTIFTILLYIKSHRLKLEEFKLKSSTKINQIIIPINEDNSKLINKVDEQQSDLHLIKSQ